MANAFSTCLWTLRWVTLMVTLAPVLFSCTRRSTEIVFGNEDKSSKLSTVKITPPAQLESKIQTGVIDALSIEIIPGNCEDGSQGTRVKKTILQIQSGTSLKNIKVKSKCDYKIILEMGKLDAAGGSLGKVYLSNATSPTQLDAENVQGDNIKAQTTLLVTPEGQGVIEPGQLNNEPIPQPSPGPNPIPEPSPEPSPNPSPGPGPQPSPEPQPSNNGLIAGALKLDFMKYTLPAGYAIAQTAKDGDVRMASVTRSSKRLVLFSRGDQCQIKSFVSSSAQTVGEQESYKSRNELTWTTLVTKFSSPFTGKTVFNGLFLYSNGTKCAFGYVTGDTQEQATTEMKSVIDGASLNQ